MYKKVFLAILFLLISIFLWFYFQWRKEDFIPGPEKIEVINLGSDVKPLYLWAKGWGIAGNHEEIVLSEINKIKADKSLDYIFYASEVYYKSDGAGKVIFYAPKSSISEPIKGIPGVKIISLSTNNELKDYELNYSKYGLNKISVYK